MVHKGETYRVVTDLPVTVMTAWAAPYTGGHPAVLRAGELFQIANDPPATASAVYADAVAYRRLHRELVPWRERLQFWVYRGYYLCIRLDQIAAKCERLAPDA